MRSLMWRLMRRGNMGILTRLDASALALTILQPLSLHKDRSLSQCKWKKYPMKICLTFLFNLIKLDDGLKNQRLHRHLRIYLHQLNPKYLKSQRSLNLHQISVR